MTRKKMSLLERSSLKEVHKESLRVLENVGVRVADPECVNVLKRNGAKVHGQSDIVRLPGEMVQEALNQVTKTYELVNAHGVRHAMPSEKPKLISRVKMLQILDFGAKQTRVPCRQDVIHMCQIANALPCVDFSYAVDCPSADVPPGLAIIDTVGLAFAITGKPSLCAPLSEADGRAWIDTAAAATGSDNLDRDPGVLVAVCTAGPLQLEAENGRLIRHVVRRGIPLAAEPMPMAGASSPFTLAGTLLVGNAEALFLMTLANTIRPGAKVSYSSLGTIMNMSAGNISMGAPESMLLASAETAMARFYELPTYRPTCFTDSCDSDVQAGIEKAAFTLMVMMSGADLILMGGSLNNASSHSCEQVVIDHDVWELASRCTSEIDITEDTLAYETVAQVGPGGSYVDQQDTLERLRSGEHYYGGSFNRTGQIEESQTMLARAHQRVVEIVSQPLIFRAPESAVKLIKQYVRDEAKSLRLPPPAWTE